MITDYALCIKNIQQYSKSQGITMKYLCDLLGKRKSFLAEVRNGKDKLDDNELDIIAEALHTTPAYLKGETDDPKLPSEPETWTVPNWVGEIKKDPRKENILANFAKLSTEELESVQNMVNMLRGRK